MDSFPSRIASRRGMLDRLQSPEARGVDAKASAFRSSTDHSNQPVLNMDETGLLHTEDYGLCVAKGVTYNLAPSARALVHSLNEWRREGVGPVGRVEIIKRSELLYLDDPVMTRALENIWDRKLHDVLLDSRAWRTLVKPVEGRKGLYYLDL